MSLLHGKMHMYSNLLPRHVKSIEANWGKPERADVLVHTLQTQVHNQLVCAHTSVHNQLVSVMYIHVHLHVLALF